MNTLAGCCYTSLSLLGHLLLFPLLFLLRYIVGDNSFFDAIEDKVEEWDHKVLLYWQE